MDGRSHSARFEEVFFQRNEKFVLKMFGCASKPQNHVGKPRDGTRPLKDPDHLALSKSFFTRQKCSGRRTQAVHGFLSFEDNKIYSGQLQELQEEF